MSLKKYIEFATHRYSYQLNALAKEEHSVPVECRCSLCKGIGYLMARTSFAAMPTSSQQMCDNAGRTIYSTELMPCPTCKGSGWDSDAVAQHAKTLNTQELFEERDLLQEDDQEDDAA